MQCGDVYSPQSMEEGRGLKQANKTKGIQERNLVQRIRQGIKRPKREGIFINKIEGISKQKIKKTIEKGTQDNIRKKY